MPSDPLLLVLNAGSSSLKLAAFVGNGLEVRAGVERTNHSTGEPRLWLQDGDGREIPRQAKSVSDRASALRAVLDEVAMRLPGRPIAAIGHRVVHGGYRFTTPARVTPDVLTQLETLVPLAPLHQPHNLAEIRVAASLLPEVPQVACFDTAFHVTMQKHEQMLGLLSVTDHCLRSRNYVNVIVAGKQSAPQWLSMEEAEKHCAAGLGIWQWASNDNGADPDVVMACCGDVPTLETLAAVDLMRLHLPELKVRVVNVVNFMKLQPTKEHPHGLTDDEFDGMFTTNRQIVFAFHGYPSLIHQLTYRRTNHANLHVRGYKEEGSTTTPFDMVVMNDMDRFHLVMDVIDRVPGLAEQAKDVRRQMVEMRSAHKQYIAVHGIDMPEIINWRWRGGTGLSGAVVDTGADHG